MRAGRVPRKDGSVPVASWLPLIESSSRKQHEAMADGTSDRPQSLWTRECKFVKPVDERRERDARDVEDDEAVRELRHRERQERSDLERCPAPPQNEVRRLCVERTAG